jgi:uncharacterized protein YbcC (UPF0753/DUF2309 family)
VEEYLNTIRYAQRSRSITNSLRQNVVDAVLSPAHLEFLQAENKILKDRILNLKRDYDDDSETGKSRPRRDSVPVASSIMPIHDIGFDLTSVRAKLRQVEEEAKVTRAHCNSFKAKNDTLKGRYEDFLGKSAGVSKSSVYLSCFLAC